jgi:hypothetical protein
VFDRVEKNIVEMRCEILLVADGVFPEPPLPYSTLSLAASRWRNDRFAAGQRPDRVEMIRNTIATVSTGYRV